MKSTENQKPKTDLTVKDYSVNAVQAILKGIPYIGEALEQFVFGPLAEIRMRRIEATLQEMAATLEARGKTANVVTEEFVNLLEKVAPKLSRTTSEEKRKRFRDLLLNAATRSTKNADWEEADLASTLLDELEPPGLAILVAMARCKNRYPLTLSSKPVSQVYDGELNLGNPDPRPHHVIPYDWTVVEEWARRLREKRLISFQTHDGRGGFGGATLTELGRFLIDWILADDNPPTNQA